MAQPCWITTDGEVIECPNPMDHLRTASVRFPEAMNPEKNAENLGWIKISGYRSPPFVYARKQPTQSQIDTLFLSFKTEYPVLIEQIQDLVGVHN